MNATYKVKLGAVTLYRNPTKEEFWNAVEILEEFSLWYTEVMK